MSNIKKYRTLAWFLLGFLLYSDGVQTVISQSPTFALQDLNFTEGDLAAVILMIQLLAFPGALCAGYVSDKLGQKTTLMGCLLIWIGTLVAASFIHSKAAFWVLGAAIALVLGGTQSVSRAIMGLMTPENQTAKFFGFFNLTGKATGFLGPFAFGLVVATTGSPRYAILAILPFFLVGTMIIAALNLSCGSRQSNQSNGRTSSRGV